MTSAQTMRNGQWRRRIACAWSLMALAGVALASCTQHKSPLTPPATLASPYADQQVWAVAPFLNESGVSIVAGDRVADAFVAEAQQIDGIDTIPVNRVIAAMRSLNMSAVTTPQQAAALLRTLGVDGLIVGTVTAYDPYDPPRFGAAIALFSSEPALARALDPIQATRARTDEIAPGAMSAGPQQAQASGLFDAGNHMTLLALADYARGRSAPDSAFGERIYLVRMDLYTQFAAFRLLHDLLESEQARLLPEGMTTVQHPPGQ